ncbi:NADPH-dependent FMN reductase [Pontibacter cellulosilyticus]|uniref:NAD(P)H-dependent oxidoreductase n=1 Tax=Pontibacter cellulosilyticus TaxID=1720253 RepID=A0A923N979_9BACT|nr:NAD(P)H-dependent oxidoreductase [Pontibacter cellulosilyticus]MBC5994533.1 NAD(P)H-dependent oxidoreductase [Pontibacter cellulosilyticus]
MPHIAIISSSVRTGRNTHRVALFFEKYISNSKLATSEILDLKEYNFPIFEERLKHQDDPAKKTLEFADKIKKADGVIIATPEYNGGYPASLKNVVDLLYDEWHRKPIGLVTVSAGAFGGTQVMRAIQFTLWKMHAWVVPAMFPVPKVESNYDEHGNPTDKEGTEKRAHKFLQEMLWCIKAKQKMNDA